MTDIEVDPFGAHGTTDETTDETFPLIPTGYTDEHIDASGEHQTSFGGLSTRVLKLDVEVLCERLSESMRQNLEVIQTDLFGIRYGELYYRNKSNPLTSNGRLRPIGSMADILGKKVCAISGLIYPKE